MAHVRIIGIDPGLRRCGWGIIESEGNRLRFVAAGTITPPVDLGLPERLRRLFDGLSELIRRYLPDEAARQRIATAGCLRAARDGYHNDRQVGLILERVRFLSGQRAPTTGAPAR